MSQLNRQQYADLSEDSYEKRNADEHKKILIGKHYYKVLATWGNPKTDYQGAVYQDVETNTIVAAHRGTESLKDGIIDLKMVFQQVNSQLEDATTLTLMALRKAEEFHKKRPDMPKPKVEQTGHSLGGSHTEIQVHLFEEKGILMEGVTFNGYGAAGLHGVPEKDNGRLTAYVKASDVVSAANPHYGRVVVLATEKDLAPLKAYGYNNERDTPTPTAISASLTNTLPAHGIKNFTGSDSILSRLNYRHARSLADDNEKMIQDFRSDIKALKNGLSHGVNEANKAYDIMRSIPTSSEIFMREIQKSVIPPLMENNTQTAPALGLADMPEKARQLCEECKTHLVDFHKGKNIAVSEDKLDRMAAAAGVQAYREGFPGIQALAIHDGEVRFGYRYPHEQALYGLVNATQAAATPVEESVVQSRQAEQELAQKAQQREMAMAEYHSQSRGRSIS
ncbi:MAG: lipase [Neisseria sp.]|uniref:lipase n=1 Tax=Neisseria sp. TaxID=192066 RepID=UPI0026DC4E42|nr:lipase [Neisseria sp.]MDO4640176.1 lipase [Neisseria sp.]